MSDIISPEILSYIIMAIGLALISYSILRKTKKDELKRTGIKTEGIILELGFSSNYTSDASYSVPDKITIRFLTKTQEWITRDISQDFAAYYNQYTPGEKIVLYYDESNPDNFYVETKQSELTARIILAIAGLIILLWGIYRMLVNVE
ncbi:MAG: DUF3592 domain-containing protein [Agriterribacter sp.]